MQESYIADTFLMNVLKQCPDLHQIYREQEAQYSAIDPYCLIQSNVACAYAMEHILQSIPSKPILPEQMNAWCNQIIIASVWQYTRSVYRFDPLLYQELIKQELEVFPDSILEDLPEPSIFIETRNDAERQEGFFAQVDKKGNHYVLFLMFISNQEEPLLTQLPIRPYENLSHIIDDLLFGYIPEIEQRHYIEEKFKQALNLILYFGCHNVDYSGRKKPTYQKQNKPKKSTTYYTMGKTIGNAIRDALAEPQERGKQIPHIRRAHYHHYWTGKRNDDRTRNRIRRFVYPIFVNCHDPKNKKNLHIKTRYLHIKESK